jgi:hypothetical protein
VVTRSQMTVLYLTDKVQNIRLSADELARYHSFLVGQDKASSLELMLPLSPFPARGRSIRP